MESIQVEETQQIRWIEHEEQQEDRHEDSLRFLHCLHVDDEEDHEKKREEEDEDDSVGGE